MNLELVLFTIALIVYVFSAVAFVFAVGMKKIKWQGLGLILAAAGFVIHTASLVVRAINARRVPLSNQFEFATSFAWGIVFVFLILAWRYKLRAVGAIVMPLSFLLMGYASMLNKDVRPLMPALQSAWLPIHVGMAVIGYGAFALAAALGLLYLWRVRKRVNEEKNIGDTASARLELYDFLSYRSTAFGLLMLTLVILTGMIWAKSAWGRYWSWDPKETWSLITWVIYAVYLHLRLRQGWRGKKAAWFSVIGFLSVLFTFVGVNYILPGLHSYF